MIKKISFIAEAKESNLLFTGYEPVVVCISVPLASKYSVRDSNPHFRRERAGSLASKTNRAKNKTLVKVISFIILTNPL